MNFAQKRERYQEKESSSKVQLIIWENRVASAGNRTWVARVAGEHSTTEPPMLHVPKSVRLAGMLSVLVIMIILPTQVSNMAFKRMVQDYYPVMSKPMTAMKEE